MNNKNNLQLLLFLIKINASTSTNQRAVLIYCSESELSLSRETSDPSGTAQNEQNNKPWKATLVPGDQISDIIWRGSKCFGILFMGHA